MTASNNLNRQDKFEETLALLAAGLPLETILADAGQDAVWLRPLLEIAGDVSQLKQIMPIPPPHASMQKLLAHGRQLAARSSPPARPPTWQSNLFLLFRGGFRLAAGLITVLLVMVLLGGAVNLAAQRSLPGDSLYWFKQAGETLRLNLTRDPARREVLNETFNRRRLLETEALLEQGKESRVTFEHTIEFLTATTIGDDGVIVTITPQTKIIGQLAVGARVRVEAVTQPPDQLIGLTITVLEPGPAATPTTPPPSTVTPAATLSKAQATDSLPELRPTPTLPKSQEADTIKLPSTPPTDNDNENPNEDDSRDLDENDDSGNTNDVDDRNDNDNDLDNIDDDNQPVDDGFENENDIDDDGFNDNDDEFDNDNQDEFDDSEDDENKDENEDHSGSGGGGDEDHLGSGGGDDDNRSEDQSEDGGGSNDDSGSNSDDASDD